MSGVEECSVAVCMISRQEDGWDVGKKGVKKTIKQRGRREVSRVKKYDAC
jgi:hypothetical protein